MPVLRQSFDLVIDTSIAHQRFTTDCEVCCRPFEVFAECEPAEILSLEVRANRTPTWARCYQLDFSGYTSSELILASPP